MSSLLTLSGTFLMFSGFFSIFTGIILYKMKQEDLGRMYMSLTMMGGESEWNMTTVLRIVVDSPSEYSALSSGDHAVKVIANDDAASDRLSFRIS